MFPDTLDLRPELSDNIAQNAETHLRESALAAGGEQVMIRGPTAGNHSGAKGRGGQFQERWSRVYDLLNGSWSRPEVLFEEIVG